MKAIKGYMIRALYLSLRNAKEFKQLPVLVSFLLFSSASTPDTKVL